MTAGYESVELLLVTRRITVSHEDDLEAAGHGRLFPGVLRPFSGVLGAGVSVGEWPPPALSHLVLDRLVVDTLGGSGSASPSSTGSSSASTDDAPSTDEGSQEPRVRDVIRRGGGGPDETAEQGIDVSTELVERRGSVSVATGRSRPGERSPIANRSGTDDFAVTEAEQRVRWGIDRSGVTDSETTTERSGTDEEAPDETVRPATGRSEGPGRSQPEATEPDEDGEQRRTADTGHVLDERQSGSADRSGATVDRSEITVDGTRIDEQGVDPSGLDPTRRLTAGLGARIRRSLGLPLTVSRSAPPVSSVGWDRPDGAPRVRSFPDPAREPAGRRTSAPDQSRREPATSRAGTDAAFNDWSVVEPPTGSAAAGRETASVVGSHTTTRVSTPGRSESGSASGPRMTVRRGDGTDRGSPRTDASGDVPESDLGVDRREGLDGAAGASGIPSTGALAGNDDRDAASDLQLIDDPLDVDRLVDRVLREFERNARIERERRGR